MNRLHLFAIFLVVGFSIHPLVAVGQAVNPASESRDRGWVTIGFGIGIPNDLSASMTINRGRERNLVFGYHAVGFLTSVNAINVSVGRSAVGRWGRVGASVGPALVWKKGGRGFMTGGGLVSLQLIFTPVKELGVGIDLWGNLNPKESVAGVGLALVFEGNK